MSDGATGPAADDARRLAIVVLTFGVSLGVTAFAYPLLALKAGLGAAAVGLLAAASAAVQMATRLVLPALLARFRDTTLMQFSLAAIMVSALSLLFTSALAGFVAAQAVQGLARGLFHTSSQTHGVRNPGIASRRLASVQAMAQFGRLIGPAVAGSLALISLRVSLSSVLLLATTGMILVVFLESRPPYRRLPSSERRPIWRRAALAQASWGGAMGGIWSGIGESYIPVILSEGGVAASTIGWLMSGSSAAGFLTTASVAKWGRRDARPFIPITALVMAVALAAMPFTTSIAVIAALMLAGGSAGGVAGVFGQAVANASVDESEQGAAIALIGTDRAGTRLAAPALVSAALGAVALSTAMIGVGAAVLAPLPWLWRPRG